MMHFNLKFCFVFRYNVQSTLEVTVYDFNLLHIISTLVSDFSVSQNLKEALNILYKLRL